MSITRLRWDEEFRFTGFDSYGREVAISAGDVGNGAKPSDLLPIALAACTAYDVVNILRKQRQDLQGLETEIVSTQDSEAPWTFTRIELRYHARGAVDLEKARKALALSEAKYCSVAASLRPAVEIVATIDVTP